MATQGIDLSTSCTFCVGSHDSWSEIGANTQDVAQDDSNKGIMGKNFS